MFGHQDPVAHLGQRDLVEPYAAPGHVRGGVPAEPVDHGRGLVGAGSRQHGQPARDHPDPGLRIVQGGRELRGVERVRGRGDGLQGQEPDDAPGGDHAPGEFVAAVDEEVHRHDEDRDIAVHRHQLADGDVSLGGQPGREPGHRGQQDGRQPHGERLDPARHRADPVPLSTQLPRVTAERVREQLLAAEAVQDAQTAREIADARGQDGLPFPVPRLGPLEAERQRPDEHGRQRNPEQEHRRQLHRDRQQQRGHDAVGDDRGQTGSDDGQRSADRVHIAHADRDDLPRADLPRQGRAEPGRVLDHEFDRTEVGVHPDLGHRAVAYDTQTGVEHSGPEHGGRPASQRRPVARLQSVVDRPGQQIRRQRQESHPHGGDRRAGDRPVCLPGDQPPQEPPAAPAVRCPRRRVRVDHRASSAPSSALIRPSATRRGCRARPGAGPRTGPCPRRVRRVCRPRRPARAPSPAPGRRSPPSTAGAR